MKICVVYNAFSQVIIILIRHAFAEYQKVKEIQIK